MKRYFSIIAVMALVLCMLVGCGSKKDDTSSKSAKQEETVAPESTDILDRMQKQVIRHQMIQTSFQVSIMWL